ncbi:MAG: hypothetical protein U0270_36905 [Labilithrix sp.]
MKRGLVLGAALAAASAFALMPRAGADEGKDQQALANARCANRLSIALTGKTAADLEHPKQSIEGLLQSEEFNERFARFINTEFNAAPGQNAMEDAPYYIAKRVLQDGRPWSDTFLGTWGLRPVAGRVAVAQDANGLGYFRSEDWYKRYEGNEESGIKLATAYRIMNNVVGLKLVASTNSPSTDQTATGRHASPCNSCHFDGWFALDQVASILPKKGQPFDAYKGGPKAILGGKQIANDKELVTALVESENFSVNACRLAFKFLYARVDNKCDGPVLDRCVDAFKEKKTIQSALNSIATEAGFCE